MYNILVKAKIPAVLCAFLVFLTLSSFQKSDKNIQNPADHVVVIIDNLDAYMYGDILIASRANPSIELSKSCIPSHLLLFKKANADQSFSEFKIGVLELINSSSNAEGVSTTNYNLEEFNSICSQSRVGQ